MKSVKMLIIVMLTTLVMVGAGTSALAATKAITLKGVHFLPGFMDICKEFKVLTNKISEQSNGELQIKILGGPDVIPPPEQAEALRKGIIDCLMCPTEYYKGLLPEAVCIPSRHINTGRGA